VILHSSPVLVSSHHAVLSIRPLTRVHSSLAREFQFAAAKRASGRWEPSQGNSRGTGRYEVLTLAWVWAPGFAAFNVEKNSLLIRGPDVLSDWFRQSN